MTTPSEWNTLAARCEAAEGADREINIRILTLARGLHELSPGYYEMGNWYYSADGDEINPALPDVTASIDSVVALIGEKLPGQAVDILRAAISAHGKAFNLHMRFATPEEERRLPQFAAGAFCRAMATRGQE